MHTVSGGDARIGKNLVIEARAGIVAWIKTVLSTDAVQKGSYAHPQMDVRYVPVEEPEEIDWSTEGQGWMAQQVEFGPDGTEIVERPSTPMTGKVVEEQA